MKRLCLLTCCFFLWFTTQAIAASGIPAATVTSLPKVDLTPYIYVLHDHESATAHSIIKVPDNQWVKFKDANKRTVSEHNFWFQVKLETKLDTVQRAIEINNPLLDKITIYHLIDGVLIDSKSLGDTLPFSSRDIQHNDFIYQIDLKKGQQHSLLFHVETIGSAAVPMTLWSNKALFQSDQNKLMMTGVLIGMLFGVGIFSLFFALATGSFSYGYFSGYVFAMTLLVASLSGYGYQFLWPNSPYLQGLIMPLIIPISMTFALMLTEKILDLKRNSAYLVKFCRLGAIFTLVLSLLAFVVRYDWLLLVQINMAMLLVCMLIMITFLLVIKGHKLARLYALGWGAILFGAGTSALSYLGVISFNTEPQFPIMIGLGVEVIMISSILAIRYNNERKAKSRIQQKALMQAERIRQVKEEALKAETQSNELLGSMVQERTLELEIAYRELNEAHHRLKEQSTIDTLTGVKNRSTFDKRLTAEAKLSRRQQTPLAVMMLDIDKFKLINDTYGHLAGDEALKFIANAIASQLKRPTDLVSRYGGEEFAIILPATDRVGALKVAENIRQFINQNTIKWKDQSISLTVSIGVAADVIFNEEQAVKLLEQADKALYYAKDTGRDQVQPYSLHLEVQES
ncbi:diguanylate cyclase [Parashewanella tropica]|uniref:diguanylate cyclase n=1 Tax=Parashewanella tropica TaxID=2547970 RepID=UPI001059D03A|nr:diguanylate cyclase [Parashewanella tropica]